MLLFIDLNTRRMTFGSVAGAVSGEEIKIRQTDEVRLQFHRNGVLELIDTDDDLYIGLKASRMASLTLAEQGTWTHASTTADFYKCALSLNTDNIISLFGANPTKDKITVFVELIRTPDGEEARRTDDAWITLVRSTFTGTETEPSPGPTRTTFVLNAEENALEVFINGVSKKWLHLVDNEPE